VIGIVIKMKLFAAMKQKEPCGFQNGHDNDDLSQMRNTPATLVRKNA
jgi:hypothetical protein